MKTIEEIKEAKVLLEQAFARAIISFEKENSVSIESIIITQDAVMGKKFDKEVTAKIIIQ
jgi:hypothetical protein